MPDRSGDPVAAARFRHPEGIDALLDLVSYVLDGFEANAAVQAQGGRGASPNSAAGDGLGRANVMALLIRATLKCLAALLATPEPSKAPIEISPTRSARAGVRATASPRRNAQPGQPRHPGRVAGEGQRQLRWVGKRVSARGAASSRAVLTSGRPVTRIQDTSPSPNGHPLPHPAGLTFVVPPPALAGGGAGAGDDHQRDRRPTCARPAPARARSQPAPRRRARATSARRTPRRDKPQRLELERVRQHRRGERDDQRGRRAVGLAAARSRPARCPPAGNTPARRRPSRWRGPSRPGTRARCDRTGCRPPTSPPPAARRARRAASIEPPPGSASSRMPAAASATHSRSSGRREANTATSSGPANSIVTATPSGIRSIAE